MRFKNETRSAEIESAIIWAKELLLPYSPMMKDLRAKNDWKYNSGTGEKVFISLLSEGKPMEIRVFTYWNPFSSMIGTYGNGVLKINSRKLVKMKLEDIVAHILHEYAHHKGFKHGNNYFTKDKGLYSVPYFISDNCDRWIGEIINKQINGNS